MDFKIGPEVIQSYKRLSYTPWHALAEFIDNSTQSYANNVDVLDASYKTTGSQLLTVNIEYNPKADLLRVADNAMGMNKSDLVTAMTVGKAPADTTGRSKYGMGLKTAACWLGNEWTIRTSKLGTPKEFTVRVNVDQVAKGKQELQIEEKNVSRSCHYTVLEVRKLNRKFAGRTLGKIKKFLRSMYRVDFREGTLRLNWDKEQLTWVDSPDLFLTDRKNKPYKKNFEFKVLGKRVLGWVGILKRGSRQDAGFSILHANRVVRGYPDSWRPETLYGQLLGSNDLVNQRLIGEIHLDDFDVSHTKDDILFLGDEEDIVEDKLAEICNDYRTVAQEHRRGVSDSRSSSEAEISAAVDEFREELESPELADSLLLKQIPPERAITAQIKQIAESISKSVEATYVVKIGDLSVSGYVTDDLSANDPYVAIDARNADEVIIVVNRSHPHWTQIRGTDGILNHLRHCTYDGIAEWQSWKKASRLDPDTIKMLKDALLRIPFEMERHQE